MAAIAASPFYLLSVIHRALPSLGALRTLATASLPLVTPSYLPLVWPIPQTLTTMFAPAAVPEASLEDTGILTMNRNKRECVYCRQTFDLGTSGFRSIFWTPQGTASLLIHSFVHPLSCPHNHFFFFALLCRPRKANHGSRPCSSVRRKRKYDTRANEHPYIPTSKLLRKKGCDY